MDELIVGFGSFQATYAQKEHQPCILISSRKKIVECPKISKVSNYLAFEMNVY